ncbi:hypothetical protein IQ06DRAFT_225183 [Phaeosphaeriaceae sp. SRC1lsM3a]|nr:hypothetical protein IQ06DRAFT_225183 [Stagonospora sp. SRC1lsM3a]
MALTLFVTAAPAIEPAVSLIKTSTNALLARADAKECPKTNRYACGSYMLEDGTRQDFVNQAWNCVDGADPICGKFDYAVYNPTHPGEESFMVAAKVDVDCRCTFYEYACSIQSYHEEWIGWEGEPNQPQWSRPVYTDKKFRGWWCKERAQGW